MNITERFVGTARLLVLSLVAGLVVLFPVVQVQPAAASIDTSQLAFNDQVCDLTAAGYEGTGAEEDPYKISDSDSLWEVADCDITTSGKAHFHLTKDINVADAVDAPTASPIGQSTSSLVYSFSGELYGNGNSIRGISISSSTHGVGLFGYIYGALLSDLSITGEISFTNNIEGDGAGGIAATYGGNVLLDQISSSVKVSGYQGVGGLLGKYSDSGKVTIIGSSNHGAITGQNAFIGGLIGIADEAEISSSENQGLISASMDVSTGHSATGGLLGAAESETSIQDSENFHSVSATGNYVGGLVGLAAQELMIERSTNSGNVTSGIGSIGTGGIVGAGGVSSTTSILSTVNSGFIEGGAGVGGLIGQDSFTVSAPVPVTQIYNSQNSGGIAGIQKIGGLVGKAISQLTISESKNDGIVNGALQIGGLIGDSTFSANVVGSRVEGMVVGNDDVGGLVGRATSSLVVTSSENAAQVTSMNAASSRIGGLVGSAYMLSAENFRNTGVVSGSDSVGGVAGITLKRGSFISTVNTATISGTKNTGGLVGYVGDPNGFVAAEEFLAYLSINEGPVVGTAQYVGGIAAQVNAVNSTISESLNRASIYGLSAVGGLVGYTARDLEVAFSFNTGTVSGSAEVGGLIGNSQANTSYLETVYSAGNINASSQFDGLVGVVGAGKTISAQAAYTVEPSNFGSQVGLAQMQSADTFNGFDFSATWGFGSCTDNLGLPMLRLLGEISSYNSVACGYTPPQPPAQNTPAPAPVLQPMPVIDQTRISSAPLGQALVTGEKFELILSASVGSLRATISELTATSFVITIPNLEAGIFSLELETSNGRISYQGLVEVMQSSGSVDESESLPVALPRALQGVNPWSSWLNKSLLAQIEELVAGQEVVTCVTYNDRPGLAARKKALSRAMHACRVAEQLGIETRVFVYGKAPQLADTVKIMFR